MIIHEFQVDEPVFVLVGDKPEQQRIAFKTTVRDVIVPKDAYEVLVTEEGLKFLCMENGWIAHEDGRTFTLLPVSDQTIEKVRTYTKRQREERHARREARKEWKTRLDQARARVAAVERDIRQTKVSLKNAEYDLKMAEQRLATVQQRVDHYRNSSEKGIPRLEQLLVQANKHLTEVSEEWMKRSSDTGE